jgi:hypothetical protein
MTDSMTQWLLSKQAVLVALTLFVAAIANLIAAGGKVINSVLKVINLLRGRPRKRSEMPNASHSEVRRGSVVIIMSLLLCAIGLGILGGRHVAAASLPPNARLTSEAWDAFNKKDWMTAIGKADECIKQFRDMADDEQKQLESSKASVPTGTVSKSEKDQIMKRGPLNDVATCFFIKGQAEEALGHTAEARQAYEAAAKYTYARCYDGFWCPAEGASTRLNHLR